MHWIDILIFLVYLLMVLGIGIFFHYKNKNQEEYFIGDKKIKSWHIGLSVVATDVGGGFSIGLGGLGFVMGISGSWMLFTGLIGAWLSSVLLIPTIFRQFNLSKVYTFPQVLKHVFGSRVAFLAGLISFIGYLGFTASQLLAGAKLAKGTFPQIELHHALIVMGIVAVVYTSFGGIKAVIYTDTVQWIILMLGLIGVGIPLAYIKLGGYQEIVQYLPN
jgi:solute:Na+ symporter, SSS family